MTFDSSTFFNHFLYMAPPLEDNSDPAFRKLCYNHGADVTFTEMTRLKGLLKNNESTNKKIDIPDDTPTIIQLLVSQEAEIDEFLSTFQPSKGFVGFNLNMGCPSPQLIKLGLGCASIKRIQKANRIVGVFKKHGHQISIKLRLGMNNFEKQNKVYLNMIQNVDADFFIVHTRHGKQTYNDAADFSVYEELVKTGKNIVANGDISTPEQISQLEAIGVKGVMIGRAAVYNPAIFDMLKKSGRPVPSAEELKTEYLSLAAHYQTPDKYISNIHSRIGVVKSIVKTSNNG